MCRDQLEAVDEFLKVRDQEIWHQGFMTKILEFLLMSSELLNLSRIESIAVQWRTMS